MSKGIFKEFQSLPKKVMAVQFTDEYKDRIFNQLQGNKAPDHDNDGNPILKVITVHGETAIVRIGDWVVKDSDVGTYYPVKDDIFKKQYV